MFNMNNQAVATEAITNESAATATILPSCSRAASAVAYDFCNHEQKEIVKKQQLTV